jgi:hypothetical protein
MLNAVTKINEKLKIRVAKVTFRALNRFHDFGARTYAMTLHKIINTGTVVAIAHIVENEVDCFVVHSGEDW